MGMLLRSAVGLGRPLEAGVVDMGTCAESFESVRLEIM